MPNHLVNITYSIRSGSCWRSAKLGYLAVGGAVLTPDTIARFWRFVHIPEDRSACWLWTGNAVGRMRHGQFAVRNNVNRYAHRIAWTLHHQREIPAGLCICHHCDVPRCCNPAHLFLGTQGDNLRDAARKGRLNVPHRAFKAAASRPQQSQGDSDLSDSLFQHTAQSGSTSRARLRHDGMPS